MNVLVVGTGYVGLVTGLCLSMHGHHVTCVDQDQAKVDALSRGISPIYEPGLEDLLQAQLQANQVQFLSYVPTDVIIDIALIAVGTPSMATGEADLSAVFAVVDELARTLPPHCLLATKSTVPVGTGTRIEALLRSASRSDIRVASLPEFLREGSAINDTLNPERLVFGVNDAETEQQLRSLHAAIEAPVVVCDRATAEMIKYASNAFLATKISFINEIANICERVGADVSKVAQGMGLDSRIGASFLRAGLGYGGSCFPKDTRALVNIAGQVDYDFTLLRAVVEVNQRQRLEPIRRLYEWLGDLQGKSITLLGVAFKPGTDDVRESPSIELARELEAAGANIRFCDPVVKQFHDNGRHFEVTDDPFEALHHADAAVLVTEWPQFIKLDWTQAAKQMRQLFLFDGRNVLDPGEMEAAGLILSNIGYRPKHTYAVV